MLYLESNTFWLLVSVLLVRENRANRIFVQSLSFYLNQLENYLTAMKDQLEMNFGGKVYSLVNFLLPLKCPWLFQSGLLWPAMRFELDVMHAYSLTCYYKSSWFITSQMSRHGKQYPVCRSHLCKHGESFGGILDTVLFNVSVPSKVLTTFFNNCVSRRFEKTCIKARYQSQYLSVVTS